ncbi:MAG: TerB family tellurite resistance protein [Propionibacteriaceae bacterium]|nr:TerB family tellurite resistance protein [Propionibacteriaceae bacterium]
MRTHSPSDSSSDTTAPDDLDWSSLPSKASLLYAQVLQSQTLVDGTVDAAELTTLDEVAEQLGLDRRTCKQLHDELADADVNGDRVRTRESPVELARQLYEALAEDQRELVFTALVRDLARLSLTTEEAATSDEREQIVSIATLAFPDSAEDVVREAELPIIADKSAVREAMDSLRTFVAKLRPEDITSGNWFTDLLSQAVTVYTQKVDWKYFQDKYPGMPADAVVDQRIKMAMRYAAIEGGLSAGAYTGTVAATIGSLGGASPATVPAAVATIMTDVAYTTQLQLKLAWDIAVLYRVPLDMTDPDDLWKLIRVAFTIKAGEAGREAVAKAVPIVVRPLVKKLFSGGVLTAAKALPVVGKYLLQRTIIKVAIPGVGIPLAVLMNRLTTQLAGSHARSVFRDEARLVELADTLVGRTRHPHLLPWAAWLVVSADGKATDDETTLMRHLLRLLDKRYAVHEEALAKVIELDPDDVWRRVDAETDDLSDLLKAARMIAEADGSATKREEAVIEQLAARCDTAN